MLPAWFKFKGRAKGGNSKSTSKPKSQTNYENYGGEFEDDFARMGTQQKPPVNKPSGSNKSVKDVDDFAGNKKSDTFVEEGSLKRGNTKRESELNTILLRTNSQLQKKFMKHGVDFGVFGKWNPAKNSEFSAAIHQHINSATTRMINGTYQGKAVTHYLNPSTGLNVISSPSGNFISGWKLNPAQLKNVLTRGSL